MKRHLACVWSFANGTNGIPMPSEVSPLAATGKTNGYKWFLPLAANLADNQITNVPNDVIFKMTINENEEQIGAEMTEMTTIFSVSVDANTRFSKFQKRFLILTQLREFNIYCILLIFTGFPS